MDFVTSNYFYSFLSFTHVFLLFPRCSVFTVFSTSKDHRQGERAMAGCILVDNDKIQVINRSPQYKNKYVHRRTSVSLENLSSTQVQHCSLVAVLSLCVFSIVFRS